MRLPCAKQPAAHIAYPPFAAFQDMPAPLPAPAPRASAIKQPGAAAAPAARSASFGDSGPAAAVEQETGTAFGGRLQYNYVRRDVEPPSGARSRLNVGGRRPAAAVVDYQFLRLKFLLNKAIGQGVDPLEIFEHFDTGAPSPSCLPPLSPMPPCHILLAPPLPPFLPGCLKK